MLQAPQVGLKLSGFTVYTISAQLSSGSVDLNQEDWKVHILEGKSPPFCAF